jgi:hypothetical protein
VPVELELVPVDFYAICIGVILTLSIVGVIQILLSPQLRGLDSNALWVYTKRSHIEEVGWGRYQGAFISGVGIVNGFAVYMLKANGLNNGFMAFTYLLNGVLLVIATIDTPAFGRFCFEGLGVTIGSVGEDGTNELNKKNFGRLLLLAIGFISLVALPGVFEYFFGYFTVYLCLALYFITCLWRAKVGIRNRPLLAAAFFQIGFNLYYVYDFDNIEYWPYTAGLVVFTLGQYVSAFQKERAASKAFSSGLVSTWKDQMESERKVQELDEARKLQLVMLPLAKPKVSGLQVGWYMDTATEVGGDYYDYTLDADDNLTIVLCDATGHGMQAGTVVTATKSLFQALGNQPQIIETFSAMSRGLKNMNFPRLGMAMAMIKVKDKTIRFSSAGMPPMLLWRADGKHAEEVLLEGMPLGYTTLAEYEEIELKMDAGDTILLMSDGLAERVNNEDELFDYDRTLKAFESVATKSPDDIIQHMVSVGNEWADGRENDDDESFICLKFK